jgi:hypothetical protein
VIAVILATFLALTKQYQPLASIFDAHLFRVANKQPAAKKYGRGIPGKIGPTLDNSLKLFIFCEASSLAGRVPPQSRRFALS